MLSGPLIRLLFMLTYAGLRQAGRMLRTPTGIVAAIVMLGVFTVGLMPMLMMHFFRPFDIELIQTRQVFSSVVPLIMYAFCVFVVSTRVGASLLELSPPELQFVLAGPFSDRQILTYRLAVVFLSLLTMSIMFAVFFLTLTGSYWRTVVAILTGGMMIVSTSMALTLAAPRLSRTQSTVIRLIPLASVLLLLASTLQNLDFQSLFISPTLALEQVRGSTVGSLVTFPFYPFGKFLASTELPSTFGWLWACIGVTSVPLTVCYLVNSGFSELAVEGVARRIQRMRRAAGTSVVTLTASTTKARFSLPAFRWLRGVGPVAWLQTASAWRALGRLMGLLFFVSICATCFSIYSNLLNPEIITWKMRKFVLPAAMGVVCYLGFLIVVPQKLGFGMPSRQLEILKTLPIRAFPFAVGMIVGPLSVLWLIRLMVYVPAVLLSTLSLLDHIGILVAGCAFDLALISTINCVQAATGLRMQPEGPPDILQGARVMLSMLFMAIGFLPSMIVSGLAAMLAGVMLGFTPGICGLASALACGLFQIGVIYLSGWSFERREVIVA